MKTIKLNLKLVSIMAIICLLFFILIRYMIKESNLQRSNFFEINYEEIIKNKQSIGLSEISVGIEYIPLETNSNCLIEFFPEYYISENFIFVANLKSILQFDNSGKFIRQIGTSGQGPNEIDYIGYVSLLEEENLIAIQTLISSKILFFNFNGEFVKSINYPNGIRYVNAVTSNQFIAYDDCAEGFEDFSFFYTNESWDTLSTVANPLKWINNTGMITTIMMNGIMKQFYSYNNQTFFKDNYNDTVYSISKEYIRPMFYVNMGKYKLPNELRPENPQNKDEFNKKKGNYFLSRTRETNSYIFIQSKSYDGLETRNILITKRNSRSVLLANEDNDNSGFLNDIDGGPEFWPIEVFKNKAVAVLSPLYLKKFIDETNLNKEVKSPIMQSTFRNMVMSLDENANPVLMVVTLK